LTCIAAIASGALLLTAPAAGVAQESEKKAHIGLLVGGSAAQRGHLEQALLQGLRDRVMWRQELVLERRYADGQVERTPAFARELAAMSLTPSSPPARRRPALRSRRSGRRPSSWPPSPTLSGSI